VGWTGTLAVSRGGTGASTFGGTNTILYTSAADTLTSITTANSAVLTTNGSGVPSWTAQGTGFNKTIGTTAGTVAAGDDSRFLPNGLGDVYVTVAFNGASFSPTDATTYYFGPNAIAPTTTASAHQIQMGFAGIVMAVIISVSNNSTSGSNENGTLKFNNITTAALTTISTSVKTNGSTTAAITQTVTGISAAFAATDNISLQFDTPTWATNPIGPLFRVTLITKRT